jgi:hypothetical protein
MIRFHTRLKLFARPELSFILKSFDLNDNQNCLKKNKIKINSTKNGSLVTI